MVDIYIEGLGWCKGQRQRVMHGEYYQWTLIHATATVTGDYSIDNTTALDNAIKELLKRHNQQQKEK